MKKTICLAGVWFFVLIAFPSTAQETVHLPGKLELGLRSTTSVFGDEKPGLGAGGQFRLMLFPRVNTEWFADYITSETGSRIGRKDAHIGWSVLFYLSQPEIQKNSVIPYLIAGHCFDYTMIYGTRENDPKAYRWSSAVQSGLGMHYYLTPNFNLTLSSQYMLHLGSELDAHYDESALSLPLIIEKKDAAFEGHLLVTLSLNVRVADLWNKKR